MAEVEIHTSHAHDPADTFGRNAGVIVGVIGIVLAVVTIASHREHTAAVIYRTEANDQWSFYQAKKIRQHTMDVGITLLDSLGTDPARTAPAAQRLRNERDRYGKESTDIQHEAEQKSMESQHAEALALRFDLGEGFLELGLVLTSLYFLSRKRLFVALGVSGALIGAALAISALLV